MNIGFIVNALKWWSVITQTHTISSITLSVYQMNTFNNIDAYRVYTPIINQTPAIDQWNIKIAVKRN